ncbi:MAG: preprotein translocase subunit SecG [Endomicrobium sp.]|jgi:preprotein translocase subunit SecG|nr:preprotein translocase subunit SecG [Endomicrobium sp.]
MSVLFFALKFFHYVVCVGLIIIVILQAGKGGIVSGRGIFVSGGGSDQIFNAPSGMAFINKVTIFMLCVFFCTSLLLARFSANINEDSVVRSISDVPVRVSAESANS